MKVQNVSLHKVLRKACVSGIRWIAGVKRDALDALKKEGFEQIMQVNDDGENVGIYHKAHCNNRNEFTLLRVEGSNELQVINILGNVTMEEIKNLMAR